MKLRDPSLTKCIKNGQSASLVARGIINYQQDHSEQWVFPGIKWEKKWGNRAPTVTSAYQQTPPGWADAVMPHPGLHPQGVTHLCQRWNMGITSTELPKQYICKTPTLTPYPGKYKAVLTIPVWSHAPLLPHYLSQLQDHEEDPISVLCILSQKFHLIRVKVVQILLLIKNRHVKKRHY